MNRRHLSHHALAGAEVAVRYLPMKGVSGDYYDLLPLHEERMGLVIGDACGKGIEAAFIMASLCTSLRSQVQAEPVTSAELLARLNQSVYRGTETYQFITLSYGVWDAGTHTFTYSSAGHPPVLHYQAETGCVCELDAGGLVLGVYEDIVYPMESVSLGTGDALVLYTDGITEASDDTDELFGVERLSEAVTEHGEESSEGLAAGIMNAASEFAPQGWQDDVTLMVVKRV